MKNPAQSYYSRWANVYDFIAKNFPYISRIRQDAIDLLSISSGDIVVDIGCGTGLNLPLLADEVGPKGTVIGVDFTPELVSIAQRRVAPFDHVHVLIGDIENLPCSGQVDVIFGSFVMGMISNTETVPRLKSLLNENGTLGFLDAYGKHFGWTSPSDRLFSYWVYLSLPTPSRSISPPIALGQLDQRIKTHHAQLCHREKMKSTKQYLYGYIRFTSVTV
ncbi:MAG: class I SAM-dependent methyltransferase [Halobacteriaceae archaeon]